MTETDFNSIQPPILPIDKEYHIFISYKSGKPDCLTAYAIDTLLARKGYKCCLHEREFIPGETILGNVHKYIKRSIKVVFLLSENSKESKWCQYELDVAEINHIQNKDEEPIILRLDKCNVPDTMMHCTYLDVNRPIDSWIGKLAKAINNQIDWLLIMDEVHKRVLTQCQPNIMSELSVENELLDKLAIHKLFTPIMLEEIQAIPSRPEKVRKLLDELIRSDANGYMYVIFLCCLDISGHEHLAKMIRETEYKIRYPSETVIYQRRDSPAHHPTYSSNHGDRHLHPSASAEPLSQHNLSNQSYNSHTLPNMSFSGSIVTSPSDESASYHGNTSLSEPINNTTDDFRMENETDKSNMSSQGSATNLQDAERKSTNSMSEKAKSYKMTSTPRGFVLIINNEEFTDGEQRTGAQQDGEMLTELFTGLGFKVDMKKNQTGSEIEEVLLRFSQLETLHQVDSLIVVLMSHGNNECISGVDRDTREILSLVNFFNRDGCPAMIHKPKMFIVNACRGDKVDFNVKIGSTQPGFDRIHLDGGPTSLDKQIPSNSDFVIAYSTFPGYVSLRSEEKGSWFIQHLVEVFRDRATHEHVMDMLIEVNNRVASRNEKEDKGYSQTPAPTVSLRYKWYLHPIQQ